MSTTPRKFRPGAAGGVRRYLVVTPALLLTFLLSGCGHKTQHRSVVIETKETSKSQPIKGRKTYRLSVVPGGVYSGEELREARTADDVVAAHYSDFGPARRERLSSDSLMYVSYRVGDKVYWTAQRRRIPAGEAVLTDGANLARVRCGNRLSATPRGPVAAEKDPTEILLGELEPPDTDLSKTPGDPALAAPDLDFEMAGPGAGPDLSLFPAMSPQMKIPGILGSPVNGGGLPSFYSLPTPSMPLNTGTSGSTPSGNSGGSGGGSSNPTTPTDPSDPGSEVIPEPPTAILGLGALLLLLYLPARMGMRTRTPR